MKIEKLGRQTMGQNPGKSFFFFFFCMISTTLAKAGGGGVSYFVL